MPSDILEYVEPGAVGAQREVFSAREREVLDDVNRRVAAAESLEDIVDFLFASTRDISPCDRIGLAFTEEGGRRISAHYACAGYEPLLLKRGYAEDLADSSLRSVIERGSLRVIHDLEQYLKEHPDSASTRLLVREGVRSNLTCPLVVDGRNVGVMFRSTRSPRVYDAHQVRLHLAVAERLSQAVEKAHLIRQLEDANHAYVEMLGFVSHELKSPLASIISDTDVLTGSYLGEMVESQRERVVKIKGKARYLIDLVRDYLDLARLELGEAPLNVKADVDLVTGLIEPAIEIQASQMEERRQRLVRDFPQSPVLVSCDPSLVKIVIVNLFGNAIKYGETGGLIRLTVKRAEDAFLVTVWNQGPGFAEDQRSRLFRRFSRLEGPATREQRGSGLGLYTAWRIVQLHKGRISARSKPGHWAEFSIQIPQPPTAKGEQ